MKTRSALNSLGFSALRNPPNDVTTFLIEREGEQADAATSQAAQPSELVIDIQTELARQGFYTGDPDGRMEEETMTAIRRFQQERGLAVTGAPSEEMLAALHADTPVEVAAVLPAERPLPDGSASDMSTVIDPVAAAIRAAEVEPAVAPIPAPAIINCPHGQ